MTRKWQIWWSVVKAAFGRLAFIGMGTEYKSWRIMNQLYKSLARPYLEHYVQFWSPGYRKDIIKLERMQKRFTKILPGHAGMSSYREGWKGWDFFQESY